MKYSKKRNDFFIQLVLVIAALLALFLILICLVMDQEQQNSNITGQDVPGTDLEQTADGDDQDQMSEYFPLEPESEDGTFEEKADFQPIDLGSGLKITGFSKVTGNFPEDGSDEFCENLLAARFLNESEHTIQYTTVHVVFAEESYTFSLSTLPPGASVAAYEMDKKPAPEHMENASAYAEYIAFFPEEPSCYVDALAFTVKEQGIIVKNISSESIDKEISVFYKNANDSLYLGGITYRLRIPDGLEPGEEYQAYAPHASKNQTKVMFVTYGD